MQTVHSYKMVLFCLYIAPSRRMIMPRQSITLTKPNEEWLLSQVANDEYSSKSELINDLIRKARRAEAINQKLEQAEQSGFTELSAAEILAEAKASLLSR